MFVVRHQRPIVPLQTYFNKGKDIGRSTWIVDTAHFGTNITMSGGLIDSIPSIDGYTLIEVPPHSGKLTFTGMTFGTTGSLFYSSSFIRHIADSVRKKILDSMHHSFHVGLHILGRLGVDTLTQDTITGIIIYQRLFKGKPDSLGKTMTKAQYDSL